MAGRRVTVKTASKKKNPIKKKKAPIKKTPAKSVSPAVLYYRDTCPYSLKVLVYMKAVPPKFKINKKNLNRSKTAVSELYKKGGKVQVPCLVIPGGKAIYESSKIIDYMAHRS